ncbi:cation:proton antiporter [Micromonospora craniellae]|uniref:Cation/H(+) antiporter n=1 Tax=Micromonospora craniellae TaxID=2294034 RepID=A0A372FZ93_9ACTN|nr:cation:proton antiporter [Micromonospora craniellae]QOC93363.1 cation:proton antiporter [Micromonospora craniellae]RFS45809.1 cation/H(+) antiporter [Micromonospora craniellae]
MSSYQVPPLLLALALISLLAFGAGAVARRLRQPPVVGEVVVGILLGPTLFNGLISDTLFPTDIRPFLTALATIGVVLFMFTVGAELNAGLLRGHRVVAGTVAAGSIALPFGLGALLALYLFPRHPTDSKLGFVLFMGAAMSVTAFPVLARILIDRGLSRTWLGSVALACAAIDDVLAWSLLAVVVAVAGAGAGSVWVLLFVPYVLAMFLVVRPLLRRLLAERAEGGPPRPSALVITLVGLLLSAAFTDWIGLHYIFGAFLFGVVMPRSVLPEQGVTAQVSERIIHLNSRLLLPIFFVVAGLKVDLSTMDVSDAVELGLILAVAVGGKFVGAFTAARLGGVAPRPASALAVLMNTRGLTELIILAVGLELGMLDGQLYSSMVVMALVTTAMAGPLLQLLYPMPSGRDTAPPHAPDLEPAGVPGR